jgi:hypothetical protein
MLSILATYEDVPEETAFKMLSNDILLDKLKVTTDDGKFMECVEVAFVEENKNLLEEKTAIAKQLEKEKKARAGTEKAAAEKEKAATEKLQALERKRDELQKDLSQKESEVYIAKVDAEKYKEAHKMSVEQFNKIQERIKAEATARTKAEQEKDNQKFTYQLIVSIAISVLLVVLFEGWLHFYKWSWLWKHPNSIGLEVGFDLLMVCLIFGAFVARWKKWFFVAALVPAIFMVIPLLGGRAESIQVTSLDIKQDKNQQEGIQKNVPTVTFIDGQKAIVDFSVTFHVKAEDAPLVIAACGSEDKARDILDPKVISSIIAELETRTLLQARQDRQKIEQSLIERLAPPFKKVGLTLDNVSLREFRENQ